MSDRPLRKRILGSLPYALLILAGLACIVLIALSAVGRQGIGWLTGSGLQSQLEANYNIQITVTQPAVNPTLIAKLKATDDAALTRTPESTGVVTVPAGRTTPGPTVVARVTDTPTPAPTATFTPTPTRTSTPTITPTRTRTSTARPTLTASPTLVTPSPTPTTPPPPSPATNTPTPTPPSTFTPSPTTPVNPPPLPPLSLTVVNTSTSLISLVWSNESAADSDFAGYNVYSSSLAGGPYSLVASTGVLTGFVDSGLSSGVTVYYVVRGADSIQESTNSPEASGTTGVIGDPYPDPPPSCPPPAPPDCTSAGGPPDGTYSSVGPGEALILDLGAGNGILNGPGYDFVYFEREADPIPTGFIQMDWVTVELSIDQTVWQLAFAWSLGNETLAQNSNIAPYAISGGTNPDTNFCDLTAGAGANEIIRMAGGAPCTSWGGLYPVTPQTGIAIEIGGIVPPPVGEGYRYLRIRTRPDAPNPAEVDGIQRLN